MADQEEEPEPDFTPQSDVSVTVHDYKIKANKRDEDGNRLVQHVKLLTKDVPSGRVKINCEDLITKEVKDNGLDVEDEVTPTVAELKEETIIGKILEQLENGEWVKLEGTLTEINPQDSDEVYHNIVKNHLGTITGFKVTGKDREAYREKLEDEEDEDKDEDESGEEIL